MSNLELSLSSIFVISSPYQSQPFLCRLLQSIAPSGSNGLSDTQPQASQQTPLVDESFSAAYTSVSLCLIDTRSLLDTATSHSVLIPRIAELNVSYHFITIISSITRNVPLIMSESISYFNLYQKFGTELDFSFF